MADSQSITVIWVGPSITLPSGVRAEQRSSPLRTLRNRSLKSQVVTGRRSRAGTEDLPIYAKTAIVRTTGSSDSIIFLSIGDLSRDDAGGNGVNCRGGEEFEVFIIELLKPKEQWQK
ncbi:hypothetical protein [Nesterenkonia sp. Act20]|uniref:hypothetical protein n=1 Tax=Nesterenkonia sp. Act20 TaxID=1483432 RepID=UPI001C46EDAF|nr:hypothetical protein [Nesterenkonia sp. Act20]